jgi:pyridoxine 4-dehydrogenase
VNNFFIAMHEVGATIRVPRMGYGAMQLAGPRVLGLPEDVPNAITVLRTAVDLGIRFFDTANAYGPRIVNQLIGEALSPYPDDIVIGNKVGAWRSPDGDWTTDHRPEFLRSQVEDALRDLRADVSCLTYLRLGGDGQASPVEIPLEESLGTLINLRDEGKITHIGLSGASPEALQQALRMTPIAAVENRYNLVDRSGVEVLVDCERLGIAFVPFWPLAFGNLGAVPELIAPAQRLGVSASTVALAWLLRRSSAIIPIPGTKSLEHLRHNIATLEVAPELTAEEVDHLTGVIDEGHATLSQVSETTVAALRRAGATFGS